jgi:hypothetical protein
VRHIEQSLAKETPADVRFSLFCTYDKSIVVSMANAIGGVPFHDVGSGGGVIALLMMRDQFVFLGNAMQTLTDGIQPGSDTSVWLKGIDDVGQRKQAEANWYETAIGNAQKHVDLIKYHYANFVAAMEALAS